MAVIETYQQRVTPQGQTDTRANRATPQDFGSDVATGIGQLGSGLMTVSDELQKQKEAQDVTNTHVAMAAKEAEWTQKLVQLGNSAQPGDDNFASRTMQDIGQDLGQGLEGVTTQKGAELYKAMSAKLQSNFGIKAIGIQSELAAKDAINKYDGLILNLAKTTNTDPATYNGVVAQGKAAIDDPSGIFAKIPQTARDEFKRKLENNIALAAAQGYVRKDPTSVLGSFSPEILASFNPTQKALDINKAPGGSINISKETMKVAPDAITASGKVSVNPNIVLAQIDLDGIGTKDPKAEVTKKTEALATLVNAYGGDYTKALAASKIGVPKVQAAMEQFGTDWQNHLPDGTSQYIDQVLSKSGAVASTDNPPNQAGPSTNPEATAQAPAKSSLPFMNQLTYAQQDQIVDKGVQLTHMKMTMDNMAQAKQEHELRLAQDNTMKDFYKQIIDPKTNGAFSPIEVINNQTLTQAQQQHLIDTAMSHTRSKGELKSHPEEVNRLMKRIIADSDDPTKIITPDAVRDSLKMGRINAQEFVWLDGQVNQIRDGEGGGSLQKQIKLAYKNIEDSFMKDFIATSIPGGAAYAADATMRMRIALDEKVKELRQEGKDIRPLFDPGSKEYFMSDSNKKAYMPKAMQIMSDQADKTVTQEAKTLPTYLERDRLKKGDQYTDAQGNIRTKQ